MKIKRTILSALFLCAVFLSAPSVSTANSLDNGEYTKISHEELTGMLNIEGRTISYGPFMISSVDTLRGPLIVISGSLDIQSGGVLLGDAWVINGKIVLTGKAKITGRAELVNSRDYISLRSEISNGIYYYKSECALDYKQYEDKGNLVFIKKKDPLALNTRFLLKYGYPCRVDYGIIRAGLTRHNPKHKEPYTSWTALLHIPIWKETRGFLGFDAELRIPLFNKRADFVARAFKRTETNDIWQLSRLENGVIATLSGDDFADYYEKRGAEGGIVLNAGKNIVIESFLTFQRDMSLKEKAIPSLLRNVDKWKSNPSIDEGNRLAVRINLVLDTRDESGWKYDGWKFGFLFEKGIADGPGDFSYSAFKVDAARYNELPAGLKFDMGFRLFSSFNKLPEQLTHSITGYTGIRGLSDDPFNVHRGDRLAMVSGELRKPLPELPLLRILFNRADFLIFFDTGILADSRNKRSPLGFLNRSGEWKKSAGVGISGKSFLPYLGIYLAHDIDSDNISPRLIVRAQRSF